MKYNLMVKILKLFNFYINNEFKIINKNNLFFFIHFPSRHENLRNVWSGVKWCICWHAYAYFHIAHDSNFPLSFFIHLDSNIYLFIYYPTHLDQ